MQLQSTRSQKVGTTMRTRPQLRMPDSPCRYNHHQRFLRGWFHNINTHTERQIVKTTTKTLKVNNQLKEKIIAKADKSHAELMKGIELRCNWLPLTGLH